MEVAAIPFAYEGQPATQVVVRDITERKQAGEALQARTDELTRLYELSRDLAMAGDLDAALDIVTRHVTENADVTFCRVAIVDGEDLVIRAAFPVRPLGHDLQIGTRWHILSTPHCAEVMESHAAVVLTDTDFKISRSERQNLLLDFAPSLCLIPLSVGEAGADAASTMGLLMISESRESGRSPLTAEKLLAAQSTGNQAAISIRRMLLAEQTERRLQQVLALRKIDEAIGGSFDLRTVLGVVLDQAKSQLGADAASIALVDRALGRLDYAAQLGFATVGPVISSRGLGGSYGGRVVLEQRPILIPSAVEGMDGAMLPTKGLGDIFVGYTGWPLSAKGQVLGVLELFDRTHVDRDQEWLDYLGSLASRAAIAIDDAQLFAGLQRSNTELRLAYDATIEGWSHALDLRDKETEGHTKRVAALTARLASSYGLGEAELVHVRWGGLLHDIGKMGVPDRILLKPGPLTDEEWVAMKKHPTFAYEMLSPIGYLSKALDIPYCHHEKWDGTGYPRGLKGENIPLTARLFAVVDVWDALTSDRPYRPAWTEAEALKYILEESGRHFDPQVVEAFLKLQKR